MQWEVSSVACVMLVQRMIGVWKTVTEVHDACMLFIVIIIIIINNNNNNNNYNHL